MAAEEPALQEPLLRTKLHRPPPPTDLVARPATLARLDAERVRPLMLISAPAGFGKSVLVSNWLERCEWPSAWVSLDTDDSDLRRFLSYFIHAIRGIFAGFGEAMLDLLKAPQLPSVAVLAAHLSNELDALEQPFVIVLDDYHRIDAGSAVQELLARLLEFPPIPLHIAIVTRRDPPLPVVALRAQGQVCDIRMSDLQFSRMETAELLQKSANVSPSDAALTNLEQELEGWAVGLRLLALALRNVDEPQSFLINLRGGVQQAQEYLLQEVVARQAPAVRDWLLRSAILGRFCAPLCEAVCAQGADGSTTETMRADGFIRQVLSGNLFVIALDTHGEWFRYHHLFSDLLQRELVRRAAPGEIAALHTRASEWLESHDLITEAIDHAIAADNPLRAAEIVERHRMHELDADRWYVVERWLNKLPPAIREERVDLLLAKAWVAEFYFRRDEVRSIVERVESLMTASVAASPTADAEVMYFRGYEAYYRGEGEISYRLLERAAAESRGHYGLLEAESQLMLSLARHMIGQQEVATETLRGLIRDGEARSGGSLARLHASLQFMHQLSGDLGSTREEAAKVVAATGLGSKSYSAMVGVYVQGYVSLQLNDLDEALRQFTMAVDNRYVLHTRIALDALAGLALTQHLLVQRTEAASTLAQMHAFAADLGDPDSMTLASSCALRLGLSKAGLSGVADTPPSVSGLLLWLEVPWVTQARAWITDGSEPHLEQAERLLHTVREFSEACRYTNQVIEIAVLQSLLIDRQGRGEQALASLEEALSLAAPGGWIRPFVEPGQPMIDLLEQVEARGSARDHLNRVLNACRDRERFAARVPAPSPTSATRSEPMGSESLTKRELDILELLAVHLQNKQIAARLHVSAETVKSHLKHLYQKLDVHNRRAAVARAADILATRATALDTPPGS